MQVPAGACWLGASLFVSSARAINLVHLLPPGEWWQPRVAQGVVGGPDPSNRSAETLVLRVPGVPQPVPLSSSLGW
jgi:hypothetical protein